MATRKHSNKVQRKKSFSLIVIIVAILAAFLIAWLGFRAGQMIQNKERLARINAIYDSVQITSEKYLEVDNVFGDKRPYESDKGRSYSSSKQFTIGKNVDETALELDTAIKAAGFTRIKDPYPGSVIIQYHYKSEKGEYLRLTVSSRTRDEAGRRDIFMTGKFTDAFFAVDPNAGPSNVTLKVNLDDNNE